MDSKEGTTELWASPAVHPVSRGQVEEIASSLKLGCSPDVLDVYTVGIADVLKSYQRIHEMVEPALPVKYPRTPGYRPPPEENSLNAWYYKCDIKGAATGKLAGKRVGIKDNTAVAGVPMMNGSKILEGYVPEFDASVVSRILDAGGQIVGKTASVDLSIGGGGFNNSMAPVLNPVKKGFVSGGSSSGSAALLAAGEIDMATGCDQGGSIRIPACWCGIVGMKPTWGLVPYTGILPIEMTLDHCGPMAKTVRDCSLLLEVLAGYDDGNDPRQPTDIRVPEYSKLLPENLKGKRIAVLLEGFENCEADIASMVKSAAGNLERRGAVVKEVSLPMHKDGVHIWSGIAVEGLYHTMVKDNGHTVGWKGQYFPSMLDKLSQGYATRALDFSELVSMFLIAGNYMQTSYPGRFYAKAQNLGRLLSKKYDEILENFDVIVMPTLPFKPPKIPKADSSLPDRLGASGGMIGNTAPFDVTGHPSITVNVGHSEGFPVGMQITGKKFEDLTVLQVAHVAECIRDEQQSSV